jgi:hypothetical protein
MQDVVKDKLTDRLGFFGHKTGHPSHKTGKGEVSNPRQLKLILTAGHSRPPGTQTAFASQPYAGLTAAYSVYERSGNRFA